PKLAPPASKRNYQRLAVSILRYRQSGRAVRAQQRLRTWRFIPKHDNRKRKNNNAKPARSNLLYSSTLESKDKYAITALIGARLLSKRCGPAPPSWRYAAASGSAARGRRRRRRPAHAPRSAARRRAGCAAAG